MARKNPAGETVSSAEAIGLCARCVHHRAVRSARGPIYHRCALAEREESFDKYPRLPVQECEGFERKQPSKVP